MGEATGISWTNATFNPWRGCTAISPGCEHCYAEALVERWGGDFTERKRTTPAYWRQPLRWNRTAAEAGTRLRVFCASLADVFDNQVPPEWRADLWELIRACPNLDWQLLTKRPMNIKAMLPYDWYNGWPNVWLGTTVENNETAAQRLPHLISVPAPVHFVSCEPLLERVRLDHVMLKGGLSLDALSGYYTPPQGIGIRGYAELMQQVPAPIGQKIGWVIIGGESGNNSRAMRRDWAESLIGQCSNAGVPVWFKQIGTRRHANDWPDGIPGKGDQPEYWPEELRLRGLPRAARG